VSAALWGFIGVIVGGLITAGANYAAERRQLRRQRGAARATALIEIEESLEAIELMEKYHTWPVGWDLVTWNQTWAAIRDPLAGSLDVEPFRRVRLAYGSMFLLQHGLQAAGGNQLVESDAAFLERIRPRLDAAHGELAPPKEAKER
jgi:hypothetical protein